MSFLAGPTKQRAIPGSSPAQTPPIGPIDYPDSYDENANKARFAQLRYELVRDPASPQTRRRSSGTATRARSGLDGRGRRRRGGRHLRQGRPDGPGPRHAQRRRPLADGQDARDRREHVCPGDLRDADTYGNRNGAASAAVGATQVTLACADVTWAGAPNTGRGLLGAPRARSCTRPFAHRVEVVVRGSDGRTYRTARRLRVC